MILGIEDASIRKDAGISKNMAVSINMGTVTGQSAPVCQKLYYLLNPLARKT